MKKDSGNGLTPKQEQATAMLAAGFTVTDTAAAIEMDRTTVSQWQNNPAFREVLGDEQKAIMAAVHGKVIQIAQKAVATLERHPTKFECRSRGGGEGKESVC